MAVKFDDDYGSSVEVDLYKHGHLSIEIEFTAGSVCSILTGPQIIRLRDYLNDITTGVL